MVWNNNQQTHGAPGKISHLCVRRKTSLGFHHNCAIFQCTQATQRKYRKPKQAFEVYMIKSQTRNSPRKMCQDESMYH